MEITDVKIRAWGMEEPLLALVSVTMDQEFAIHDIKIVQGKERRFLAMPSRRMSDGSYRDIVHPIGSAMREKLERTVLEEYERWSRQRAD